MSNFCTFGVGRKFMSKKFLLRHGYFHVKQNFMRPELGEGRSRGSMLAVDYPAPQSGMVGLDSNHLVVIILFSVVECEGFEF